MVDAPTCFFHLVISLPVILGVFVTQSPPSVSIGASQTITITCTLLNTGYPQLYWYRQHPDRPIEVLFYSAGQDIVQNYTSESFQAKRTSSTRFSLELSDVSPSHSAVYLCACRNSHLNEAYFGGGTKLVVLDTSLPLKDPNVVLLPPSLRQLQEWQRASAVCVVSGFYPDNVRIIWAIDDADLADNDTRVQSDAESVSSDGNRTFSIASHLYLSLEDYQRSRRLRCKVDHYQSGSNPKRFDASVDIDTDTCGLSKEDKLQAMEIGKLTYLILICKSLVYATFVSVLACKAKNSYHKRFD